MRRMSYSEPPTPTEVKPEDDVILSLPYCINNNNNSDVELCGVSDWDSHPENPSTGRHGKRVFSWGCCAAHPFSRTPFPIP